MNVTAVMKELKGLAKESHAKTYLRHGVTPPMLGVPYADLYKVQKRIGIDQKLSQELWATGVHDAQVLAAFVADPEKMKATVLNSWAKTASNQLTLDAIAGLASKMADAKKIMKKWMAEKKEWHAASGWHLLSAMLARKDGDHGFTDKELTDFLSQIEKNIHKVQNRVRHEMNGVVISIGALPAFRTKALACAKRIGKVVVDHGNTACKTPPAEPYIQKIAARQSKKTAKKTTKKAAKKTAKKTAKKAAKKKAQRK